MHSELLLKRFREPAWVGDLENASVVVTEGNPTCGDVVQIGLEVRDGLVVDARFRTLGCAVAIASSDVLCELVRGLTIGGAEVVDLFDIHKALGGVALERESCVAAALAALRAAIAQIRTPQVK